MGRTFATPLAAFLTTWWYSGRSSHLLFFCHGQEDLIKPLYPVPPPPPSCPPFPGLTTGLPSPTCGFYNIESSHFLIIFWHKMSVFSLNSLNYKIWCPDFFHLSKNCLFVAAKNYRSESCLCRLWIFSGVLLLCLVIVVTW